MAKIFITGSTDGLGFLTARQLVSLGHQVFLHARNENSARTVREKLPKVEDVLIGDLSSIEETKKLAELANKFGKFNAIIHNAGIYNIPQIVRSIDGLPLVFAVNCLAPYILTSLIGRPERIVYLSSGMHMQGDASINTLTSIKEGKYIPCYSDTKLYDLVLALAVDRLWSGTVSNAVDPGWVPTKMGGNNATDDLNKGFASQVYLAVSNDVDALIGGRLLYHQKEVSFNTQAKNEEIQERFLWLCKKFSGISFE